MSITAAPVPSPRRRVGVITAAATALGATALSTIVDVSPAHAVALTPVDTLSDNPADGYTLREALDDANGMVGSDTITFAPGLTGTIVLSAQLSILDDVRIIGPGSDLITLDGGGASRVLQSQAPGTDLTVEGLTLANGSTAGPGGALIFHDGNSLTLTDVVVTGNQAPLGGGISIDSMSGPLEFTDVDIVGNTATSDAGGGIIGLGIGDDVTMRRVTVTGNQAPFEGGGGGGLIDVTGAIDIDDFTASSNTAALDYAGFRLTGLTTADLDGVVVTGNLSTSGDFGGLSVETMGKMQVDGLVAEGNDAPAGNNAGVRLESIGDAVTVSNARVNDNEADKFASMIVTADDGVSVTDSTFNANTGATAIGGPILIGNGVTLDRVSAIGNEGPGGGGVFITSNADVLVEESTIADNTTPDAGGGLAVQTTNDSLIVFNSTISGNTAGDGGALVVAGTDAEFVHSTIVDNTSTGPEGTVAGFGGATITYDHSIVAGNTGTLYNDVSGALTGVDYSLVEDTTGVLIAVGNNVLGQDPQLGPLDDNGGPTLTHLPAAGSPAIDAGDPASMAAMTDQRGGERYVGTIDIGSVERGPGDEPPPPPAPPEPPAGNGALWVPIEPARLVDTRPGFDTVDGEHAGEGVRPADSTLTVSVAGRAGVPDDAIGVIANLTAVQPLTGGFGTAHPCLDTLPGTASLNYTAGVNLGNEVIVELDAEGQACLYTETSTHLAFDVVGYVPADSPYATVEPQRFADTRGTGVTFDGIAQAGGKLAAGDTLTVPVAGRGDVPGDAAAVVMYVAAVQPDDTGFVTAFGCAEGLPNASSLNHVAGVNRGNEIIVQPDANGDVCLFAERSVHLTADVVGILPPGTEYTPLPTAARLLDTRAIGTTVDGQMQAGGVRPAGSTIEVDVAGRAGLPADAVTAVVNLTAVGAAGTGYATAFDCDGPPPLASSLNYVGGVNGGNELVVGLGDGGSLCVFVETETHLTIDVAGVTLPA